MWWVLAYSSFLWKSLICLIFHIFTNFLLIYLSCSFCYRNEFPFRKLLSDILPSYRSLKCLRNLNIFSTVLLSWMSLTIFNNFKYFFCLYLLLPSHFGNINETYSQILRRYIHPRTVHVHIWRKFDCIY